MPAQLLRRFRRRLGELLLRHGRAPSRHDVFALRLEQHIDLRLGEPRGRVAREGNAGAGGRPHIAEHHGLHHDGRALEMFEALQAAIGAGPVAHPGAVDGGGGGGKLLHRIVGHLLVGARD